VGPVRARVRETDHFGTLESGNEKAGPAEEYLAQQGRFKGVDEKSVGMLRQRIDKTLKKLAAEEAGVC